MATAPFIAQLSGGQPEPHRSKQPPWARKVYSKGPRPIENDESGDKAPLCSCRRKAGGDSDTSDRLQKSLEFVQREHAAILTRLQKEVERLKEENKDLNFKLVFGSTNDDVRPSPGFSSSAAPSSINVDHIEVLQQEIAHLRVLLAAERQNIRSQQMMRYNQHMTSLFGQMRTSRGSATQADRPGAMLNPMVGSPPRAMGMPIPRRDSEKWPETLSDCHKLLSDLQKQNDIQLHELVRLKTDLHDLLHSHKWTPEAFLLAKAYISTDDITTKKEAKHSTSLPPIPSLPQHPVSIQSYDEITLPALRSTVGQRAIMRQKGVQAVQRARQQRLISRI